ncbi:protein quaking-A-like isoform X1 [Asterias rubens]|uniref:protein quaking-A-like isoform X1 n=2 Tax=Asterias rubens TaxID=7604 RepID=UPI001454EE50|nr:protein quaking-A-like isoform X1 [Asterias rubens]XP_033635734.1 protein quaking-A-like isoform X1 [Asterias rubens]
MSVLMPNDSCSSVIPPGTNSVPLPVPVQSPHSMSNSIPISAAGLPGVFLHQAPQVVSPPMQLPVTHSSNISKIMADPSTEKQHPPTTNNSDYLAQLINDKKSLVLVPNMFMHVERIIDEEINKVRKSMYNFTPETQPLMLPDPNGVTTTLSEKLFVPVKTYPDFNFVGRILGPRGMYAKQLEKETGCKIMVRGKGSIRDKKKEEQNKGKPNWEHLEDDLHVLVTVDDTQNRAAMKMERAVSQIKKLLVPTADGEDELKKRQLMELAMMNGTFRDSNLNLKPHQTSNPNTPLIELPPGGCTFIPASPRPMVPPGAALIPQPLRSPTPATHPQLLAHPSGTLIPRMASGQALLANGMAPPMVSSADGTSFMIAPYEHYPYAMTPTMLDYPPTPSEGTIGAVPKLRRAIREHPYQRVLDTREFPGMVLGATLPLSNHLMS